LSVDGQFFPAGTSLGVPLYVLQHDEKIFPQAWEYVPDRWIVDEKTGVTAEDVARARSAYAPFLIGPMNCIGKNMGYIAIKLAIAHLLFSCDIRQAGKLIGGGAIDKEEGRRRWNEYQMQDWILGFRNGPMVEVRARA
jgi:cytochrome P450